MWPIRSKGKTWDRRSRSSGPTGKFYRKLRFQFYFPVPRFLRLYLRVRIRALRPHPPASKDRPKNKRSSGACDRPFRLLSEQATRRREKRGQLCFQSPECATRWVACHCGAKGLRRDSVARHSLFRRFAPVLAVL